MLSRNKRIIQGSAPDSIIGENTICEGKIMSESSLRIEGQLQGDIECAEDVTIGERGNAHSHIHARNIIVAGKINGEAVAKDRLYITRTGEVVGTIAARSIIIEEGGVLQGTCHMQQQQQAAEEERVHPKLVSSKHNHKQANKAENKAAGAN